MILDFTASVMAGISVTLLMWALLTYLMNMRKELQQGNTEDSNNTMEKRKLPVLMRLLLATGLLFRGFFRGQGLAAQREITDHRIGMAGMTGNMDAVKFYGARTAGVILGVIIVLLCANSGMLPAGLLAGMLMAVYPGLWLSGTIKRRHLEILKALPNMLDLLTLSVEAGKDFLSSLSDILARRKLDALGEELERALREIQLGKKRTTALRELSVRVGQEDLSAVVSAIIQADELGVSIGQLLKIQSDSMRNKRFSRAEKLANEAPVKMLAPLFLFIFPAVLVVLAVALGSQLQGLF
jgi:tight adherence protein C